MTITLEDVNKAAELANLQINEEEAGYYLKNLQQILELANQMKTVDTKSVQAAAHCFDIQQRLRPDVVNEPNARDRLQKLTPYTQSGLYCVPPVIE
ncbi:MAG: Asp-tRNA(Asn)/Glu-tRNA(Gln) amidotransferase subunit GatC [Pseudomonadota bacterium]